MIKKVAIISISLVCLITGFISGIYVGRLENIPFVKINDAWSIGIYTGKDPFNLVSPDYISNPVLTAKDVTDVPADFVADPFMVKKDHAWYMFFEVMNRHSGHGDIGLAISQDGLHWKYKQIVLDEPVHLSYPYVFKWKNEYYMIPECYKSHSIRLYKAVNFPTQWSFIGTLLYGSFIDSSIFRHHGKWWIFTTDRTESDILRLYYAKNLMGPWIEHPKSPIIMRNANIARPGGRVLIFDNQIIRYTQDDDPTYGNQIRAFKITKLTTRSYEEKEISGNPILKASGIGWNKNGMHHIDPHQIEKDKWIACVDGYCPRLDFGGFEY